MNKLNVLSFYFSGIDTNRSPSGFSQYFLRYQIAYSESETQVKEIQPPKTTHCDTGLLIKRNSRLLMAEVARIINQLYGAIT